MLTTALQILTSPLAMVILAIAMVESRADTLTDTERAAMLRRALRS
jgi:hypothetical protein